MIPPWYTRLYRQWCGADPIDVPLQKVLRINTLKTSEQEVKLFFAKQGVRLKKIPYLSSGFVLEDTTFNVVSSSMYLQGAIYLQDAASQFAAEALGVSKGSLVLDMCASPGGKASHLAQLMENTGSVICVESKAIRVPKLKNNFERLGVANSAVYVTDATMFDADLQFDFILLDAPCSGNYVTDANWFEKREALALSGEGLSSLINTQKELLEHAVFLLKQKGRVLYCTCSLNPEENEDVIAWALSTLSVGLVEMPRFGGCPTVQGITKQDEFKDELKKTLRFWPHLSGTQGFFLALLEKKESSSDH